MADPLDPMEVFKEHQHPVPADGPVALRMLRSRCARYCREGLLSHADLVAIEAQALANRARAQKRESPGNGDPGSKGAGESTNPAADPA